MILAGIASERLRRVLARTCRMATGRGPIAVSSGDIGDINQPQLGHRPQRHYAALLVSPELAFLRTLISEGVGKSTRGQSSRANR